MAIAFISNKSVGVISSITCGHSFKDSFESGLIAGYGSPLPVTYFDQVGVNSTLLADAMNSFYNDANIGMIATFGGTVAYAAANAAASAGSFKPFISLLGAMPPVTVGGTAYVVTPNTTYCCGCVSLDSYVHNQPVALPVTFTAGSPSVTDTTNSIRQGDIIVFYAATAPAGLQTNTPYVVTGVTQGNPNTFTITQISNNTAFPGGATVGVSVIAWTTNNRVAFLKKFANCTSSDISLIYNPASPLVIPELKAWQSAWPPLATNIADAGPGGPAIPVNVNRSFAGAFETITTKAVIVSADPFFNENKETLIQAANASGKFVCYPLNNYQNAGGTKPAAGHSMLAGPGLEGAIVRMGTLAGQCLLPNSGNITPAFSTTPLPSPKLL
jgi:hypothetical protein